MLNKEGTLVYTSVSNGDDTCRIVAIEIPESEVADLVVEKSGWIRSPIALNTCRGCVSIKTMIHLRNTKTGKEYILFGTRDAIYLMSRIRILAKLGGIKTRILQMLRLKETK